MKYQKRGNEVPENLELCDKCSTSAEGKSTIVPDEEIVQVSAIDEKVANDQAVEAPVEEQVELEILAQAPQENIEESKKENSTVDVVEETIEVQAEKKPEPLEQIHIPIQEEQVQNNTSSAPTELKVNTMAMVGFITGIVALVTSSFGWGFVIGVVAIVFSAIGLKQFNPQTEKLKWMAVTGLVLGIIAVLISIIAIIALVGVISYGIFTAI